MQRCRSNGRADLNHEGTEIARHGRRSCGASLTMIDRHYGHLARDGREHAFRLLDGYADIKAGDVQLLDVRWTPQLPAVAGYDNGNAA